jgi:tetratricopeptide (TPR) repeat protein
VKRALFLLAACGDPVPRTTVAQVSPSHERAAADPAIGATTDLDGAAPAFGDAVLAELTGDDQAARAAYERVLAAPEVPAHVAARAAIHLGQIESRSGRTRAALDLVARATAVAPTDPVIAAGAASLQAEIVAAAGAGDIRGPRLGMSLPGVSADLAEAFAAAERELGTVHRARLKIAIEALTKSINIKINQFTEVVAKYQAVAKRGPLPLVAATYRTGSLYHDLALELAFAEMPPELERRSADGLRATLRGLAITYLKKAVTEYRACIDAPQVPESELWRLAAETDMRRAIDVLRAAGVRV